MSVFDSFDPQALEAAERIIQAAAAQQQFEQADNAQLGRIVDLYEQMSPLLREPTKNAEKIKELDLLISKLGGLPRG